MKLIKYINFPRSYFNNSECCHAFPEASEMFVCYAKPLPFTYLEFTLQHPRHKIEKAPSKPKYTNNTTKTTKFPRTSKKT